jgi:formylglycine-generating enzyme required for sulfatase activity
MAKVSSGSFTMGTRGDRVKVKTFCLDQTEVTAEAYGACVQAGSCTTDGLDCHPTATFGVAGKERHPINCVAWDQADAYCGAQGKRLPTEEEWEWAARGQKRGSAFPWGSARPTTQLCWKRKDGTCPVGSFPKGDAPGGIHDLAGNLWEWTSSDYDSRSRVNRGGAWINNETSFVRSSFRFWSAPHDHTFILGFRCAQ